jgi:DNA repair exonuclease SbcCD ATPase subunit
MATKSVKTAPRTRRPKAEVLDEFAGIQKEVESSEPAGSKTAEAAREHDAEAIQAVADVSVEGVVGRISTLGLEISRALSEISGKLVEEVDRLAAVREAAAIERKEIERLHKIDVSATALDELVRDYAAQKETLEAGISAQRTAWEEEARTTERERREQEDALKKQRQRENDEYEYKKTLERKRAQDKYDEEQRQLERGNKEKQEALERSWRERESALKDAEEELTSLRAEVAGFAARLRTEIDRAVAEAVRSAAQAHEQQIVLLKKDAETDQRLAAVSVKTLEERSARQAEQIAALQKQVEEAKQQVQDIAVRAIEGASGARALTHINQIAMEQAKNRPRSE